MPASEEGVTAHCEVPTAQALEALKKDDGRPYGSNHRGTNSSGSPTTSHIQAV